MLLYKAAYFAFKLTIYIFFLLSYHTLRFVFAYAMLYYLRASTIN